MANLAPLPKERGQTEEDFVQKLRFSARGYKSHLTNALRSQQNLLTLFLASPSQYGAQQLHNGTLAVNSACEKLIVRLQQLLEHAPDEQHAKATETDIEEYTENASKMATKVAQAFSDQDYSLNKDQVTKKPDLKKKERDEWDDARESENESDDESKTKRIPRLNTAMRPEKLLTVSLKNYDHG